ncbi:MAG: 50S ribosomal protein L4 [Patescibacteria group bacterium]
MKINVYSEKGIKKSSISLPKKFQEKENLVLLAQAIRVYEARSHPGLSKVKSRGEVSASKAKIYRQKGTGRARHGARSAPIFVGGGVTHGPRGVKRQLSLPSKMRKKARNVALTLKGNDGQLVVVDGVSKLKKTKEAVTLMNKIAKGQTKEGKNRQFTFGLSDKNKNSVMVLRNIKNIKVVRFLDLNAYKVYLGGILVIDKDALAEKSTTNTKKGVSK